jgi:hypothetical protein
MSPVGNLGPCCTVDKCTRPIHELGDLCSQHWRALTTLERRTLTWEAEAAAAITEEIDSRALAEVIELERWADLPVFRGGRRWAA